MYFNFEIIILALILHFSCNFTCKSIMVQYEYIHPLNNPLYHETSRSDTSFEWKAFGLRFSSDLPKH